MHTPATIKSALQAAITKANDATGAGDTNATDAINSLVAGYGQGGITPSGTKTITANGPYDVTEYAEAVVNISGLNARVFTKTLSSDSTSAVTFLTNDWLKSIQSNPNAFVLIRYLGLAESTACVGTIFSANFPIGYSGTTPYGSVVARQSASTVGSNFNGLLNSTGKYNGHANLDANGKLYAYGNASYPFKAGTYLIIAGILESL